MFPGTQPQDGVLALLNGPCRLSLTEQAIQSSRMDTARLPPQWPKEQSSVGAGVDPTPRLECGCLKNLPATQETKVQSLNQEDPLEKEMATHSSILAWRIHGQRSLVGYSPWGHRVRHD